MNYFITTNSEQVVIRVKTGEYSDDILCSFSAVNALAAIVACEALNSNCLSQTKATQEMEQPGGQDWLAMRDQENVHFCAEYGSDDDSLLASDYGHCDHCGDELPTGCQCYCSPQCIADANPGDGEGEPVCDDCGSTLVGIPTPSGNTYWSGCTCH